MKKKTVTWLLPVALVALGLSARVLAQGAWNALIGYQTPFGLHVPEARPAPPLVEQVVIVLVDGLAYHASRAMPFLNELRTRGADLECRIGLPSLSLPGRSVLMTGAWQEVHGQATNFNPRPLPVEHLFLTAKRRGLGTALAAGSDPQTLFSPYLDERVVYPRLHREESVSLDRLAAELLWMGETTRALLRDKRPHLFLMDYTIADEAGHGWGAASEQYRAAAGAVDGEIGKLAGEIDLGRAVLVVTSDHGHTASGGHGGPEEDVTRVPLVMVGGPVRAGTHGECEQVDVAPTIAALLGVAVPASNQGRPLLDFLAIAPDAREAILQAVYEQRSRFVAHYVARLNGRTAAGGDPAPAPAAGPPDAGLRGLAREAEEAKRERMSQEARRRLLVLMAVVALIAGAGFGLRAAGVAPPGGFALAVLAGTGAAVFYFLLFRAAGLQYSFSAVNRDEALDRFFLTNMVLAVAACALATALAAGWLARRLGRVPLLDLARLSFLVTAVFCALLVLKMAVVYWRHGIFLRWQMPDQFWAFGFYLDTLAVVALGLAAPLLPLAGWAGAALGRPLRRP
ncbi:MAG TPA: alkaline phosphatase family protein [Vicinamibacteria bacterium]|nr:alkaline phosphatase family protein [Vicinamibacteria bacterium]